MPQPPEADDHFRVTKRAPKATRPTQGNSAPSAEYVWAGGPDRWNRLQPSDYLFCALLSCNCTVLWQGPGFVLWQGGQPVPKWQIADSAARSATGRENSPGPPTANRVHGRIELFDLTEYGVLGFPLAAGIDVWRPLCQDVAALVSVLCGRVENWANLSSPAPYDVMVGFGRHLHE